MILLVEDFHYGSSRAKAILEEFPYHKELSDGSWAIGEVGYYYSNIQHDCVFILPKVVLDENDLIFGKYSPDKMVFLDEEFKANHLSTEERDFLYGLPIWIYRAIREFRRLRPENEISSSRSYSSSDNSASQVDHTFLDVILALIKFNEENQDFILFTVKNIHSGYNRINWNKTISRTQPVFQEDGVPIYLNPINKKKQVDFDEELLVIFFSILTHVNERYGFNAKVNYNYELIKGAKFDAYIQSLGKPRLLKIRHKYFSDKTRLLWKLCYDFFDAADAMRSSNQRKDYLLVRDFNIVFEAMIDELIGSPEDEQLKKLRDGKVIDHLFEYTSLIQQGGIYYIADSKYYKIGHRVDKDSESEYKQFTYARNIIQYYLSLMYGDDTAKKNDVLTFRDGFAEGYEIIPNFFISAEMDKEFRYDVDGLKPREDKADIHRSMHFENRLFDRDTLWLAHYDVNFLFIVSLYAQSMDYSKETFRQKIHKDFRDYTLKMINANYDFYLIAPKAGIKTWDEKEFPLWKLRGKVYMPKPQPYVLVLALERGEKFEQENKETLELVDSICNRTEKGQYHLGDDLVNQTFYSH